MSAAGLAPAREDRGASSTAPVLEVVDLKKHFVLGRAKVAEPPRAVRAVDGVSFAIAPGETLGMVGESGCGKSTVGRTTMRLLEPTGGTVRLGGRDITHLSRAEMRPFRREMQMIFQDPYSSLNPRMKAGDIVAEPLAVHRAASPAESRDKVAALFSRVGLRPDQMKKYPHEFSGGQRQRIGIARALAIGPRVIIADEPVSALDVSVQAQVVNLLMDLQDEFGIAYLFIAHDLSIVQQISHRIAVMYLGRVVELADRRELFRNPQHPYTEALLSAVPKPKPRAARRQRILLPGDVPSPIAPPSGCHFHTRCPYAQPVCSASAPAMREVAPNHWAACHLR